MNNKYKQHNVMAYIMTNQKVRLCGLRKVSTKNISFQSTLENSNKPSSSHFIIDDLNNTINFCSVQLYEGSTILFFY